VTQERQTLTDSLNYYKNLNDSLFDENFTLNHWNGIQELMIYNLSHENPKYKDLEKDLENYKFLLKELVEANTTRIKIQNASTEADGTIIPSVTNFIYDDNRIQTNIRKQYTF